MQCSEAPVQSRKYLCLLHRVVAVCGDYVTITDIGGVEHKPSQIYSTCKRTDGKTICGNDLSLLMKTLRSIMYSIVHTIQ